MWKYKNTGLIGILGILCECRLCRVVFSINEGHCFIPNWVQVATSLRTIAAVGEQ